MCLILSISCKIYTKDTLQLKKKKSFRFVIFLNANAFKRAFQVVAVLFSRFYFC